MKRAATPPATPAINAVELPPEEEEAAEALTQALREVEATGEVLPVGHAVHEVSPPEE